MAKNMMMKSVMQIKFNSYDDLRLMKTLKLYDIIKVVRCVFSYGNKYYPKFLLDDCFYILAG